MKKRYSSYIVPIMLLTIFSLFFLKASANSEEAKTTTTTTTTTDPPPDDAEQPSESSSQNDKDNPKLIGPAGATEIIRRSNRRQNRRDTQ